MSKKNRMYAPKTGGKNPHHVGTISADQIRKMEQAARRMDRIALETRSGQGVHEADKRTRNRADRRNGKDQARNWQKES